ncbi:MAG: hypothetical protein AAF539_04260 [Planctomycetota bacterium]
MKNRRQFITGGTWMLAGGGVLAADVATANAKKIAGSPQRRNETSSVSRGPIDGRPVRVGLWGCSSHAIDWASDLLTVCGANNQVELCEMVDVVRRHNRWQRAFRTLRGRDQHRAFTVNRLSELPNASDRMVTFERLLNADLDLVLAFPEQSTDTRLLRRLIDADINTLIGDATQIDPSQMPSVQDASDLAMQKGLSFGVAMANRYNLRLLASLLQIRRGAIGRPQHLELHLNSSQPHDIRRQFLEAIDLLAGVISVPDVRFKIDILNPLNDRAALVRVSGAESCLLSLHSQIHQPNCVASSGQPLFRIAGSEGICDLRHGRIIDCDQKTVWRYRRTNGDQSTPRQRQCSSLIGSLKSGQLIHDWDAAMALLIDVAVQATSNLGVARAS